MPGRRAPPPAVANAGAKPEASAGPEAGAEPDAGAEPNAGAGPNADAEDLVDPKKSSSEKESSSDHTVVQIRLEWESSTGGQLKFLIKLVPIGTPLWVPWIEAHPRYTSFAVRNICYWLNDAPSLPLPLDLNLRARRPTVIVSREPVDLEKLIAASSAARPGTTPGAAGAPAVAAASAAAIAGAPAATPPAVHRPQGQRQQPVRLRGLGHNSLDPLPGEGELLARDPDDFRAAKRESAGRARGSYGGGGGGRRLRTARAT